MTWTDLLLKNRANYDRPHKDDKLHGTLAQARSLGPHKRQGLHRLAAILVSDKTRIAWATLYGQTVAPRSCFDQ